MNPRTIIYHMTHLSIIAFVPINIYSILVSVYLQHRVFLRVEIHVQSSPYIATSLYKTYYINGKNEEGKIVPKISYTTKNHRIIKTSLQQQFSVLPFCFDKNKYMGNGKT